MGAYEEAMYRDQQKTSVIGIRLDTTDFLSDIKFFLSGKRTIIRYITEGNFTKEVEEIKQEGEAKANLEGINGIMSWVGAHLRSAIAQGNAPKWEDLVIYMKYLREDFNDTLMTNQVKWGISDENYNMICDTTYNAIRLFLTRTLENKERESYADTLRTIESSKLETKDSSKQGFSFFRKGGQ